MERDWTGAATVLAEQLIERYCRDDGLLARKVNCETGEISDQNMLADEIGDYCQYVAILGRRQGRDDFRDWAVFQTHKILDLCQASNGLIYPKGKPKNGTGFYPVLRMGDTFWGLQAMFLETGDKRLATAFQAFTNRIIASGCYGKAPTYGLLSAGGLHLAVPLAETMSTGYVAESLIEFALATGDYGNIRSARAMLEGWMLEPGARCGVFVRRGLHQKLPLLSKLLDIQFKARDRPGIHESILTKGDTFLLFAMLAEFKLSGDLRKRDVLLSWVDHLVENRTTEDGRFYNHLNTRTGACSSVRLEENHSVIELLLDIAHALGSEKALEAAKRAAQAWIGKTGTAGLIANDDDSGYAEIDPYLDLLINMLKLAECSGDDSFTRRAFDGMESLLNAFQLPFGYAHRADMKTGSPLGGVVETKYLGLLVKGLLLFDHKNRGGVIMKDDAAHRLATDR